METARGQLERAKTAFDSKLTAAGKASASPAATTQLEEANKFMADERTARNDLGEYMTRVSDGAGGYVAAVTEITRAYTDHNNISVARIRALTKQFDGPVVIRPAFDDWRNALEYQANHEREFPLNPQFVDPPVPGGN
ncbi:hypothetical protein ABZS29_28980 [Kribbella sp. NPDC005582]|uniref:hypothetical protein n=1 Tax=Kribbella sp. NPDC005582 TaxID=3156893 RepID=UPI0033B695C7